MVDRAASVGAGDRWHEYLATPPNWEWAPLPALGARELAACLPIALREDGLAPTPPFQALAEAGACEAETRSIHAANVDPQSSEAELRGLADRFGDVERIDADAVSLGTAIIRFYDLRAARAMRAARLLLRGRTLRFAYGPLLPIIDARRPPNNGTIVVFHLRRGVDDTAVMAEFGRYGDVRQIRTAPTKVTQRFVEYFDSRSAMRALKALKGRRVLNSKVSVEYSLPARASEVRLPTIEKVAPGRPPCSFAH
jgi:hypothetical protein